MTCPKCSGYDSTVIDSREPDRFPFTLRRRRVCNDCSHRWTTFELESNPKNAAWLAARAQPQEGE